MDGPMTAKHHLADLDVNSTDDQIARAITGHLLNSENPGGPFKLAYKFEGVKDGPPPHQCDKIIGGQKLCAVDRANKEWCRQWILDALGKGLYVQRYSGAAGSGYFQPIAGGSVESARFTIKTRARMAEFDKTRTAPKGYIDDDIPF
jgi:hypothetical protein